MKATKNEKTNNAAILFLVPFSSVLIVAMFFVFILGSVVARCFIPWSAMFDDPQTVPNLSIWVCRWMPFSPVGLIAFVIGTVIIRLRRPSASAVVWFLSLMLIYLLCMVFLYALAIAFYYFSNFGQF